ncbi:MAG: sigma-70 family RNA polymerase sigma factor [Halieaceae bacterium]|nr:sigma-70 family RNA polymerase sigma factor [Halieaceae bacterium]
MEVEDIVQETYMRVCQVENKDEIRKPQSFMFRTARNLALDHVKRAEFRLTEGTDAADDMPASGFMFDVEEVDSTYNQVASDEDFMLFCEAVRELPKQCRRAFVLKKVYGYTLKEIMA